MTKDDIVRLALDAGFDKYESHCLSGNSEEDRLVAVGEYAIGEAVLKFAESIAAKAKEEGRREDVPEGWHVVPKTLTPEMMKALADETEYRIDKALWKPAYKAMIASAPKPQGIPYEATCVFDDKTVVKRGVCFPDAPKPQGETK